METLNFTQTNKSFNYENDNFKINGTVSFQEDSLLNLNVEVYSKGNNSDYVGHLDLRKEEQDTRFDLHNVSGAYIDGILVAVRALIAKLEEDLNLSSIESE